LAVSTEPSCIGFASSIEIFTVSKRACAGELTR
jgi:hypothetical protein